jgi:hypothetical protein
MLDGTGGVHDAMIALQRAELTLQLTVQMRNKLVRRIKTSCGCLSESPSRDELTR